jgi:hypothetical protein
MTETAYASRPVKPAKKNKFVGYDLRFQYVKSMKPIAPKSYCRSASKKQKFDGLKRLGKNASRVRLTEVHIIHWLFWTQC